jgi:hypothetical protein
MLNKWYFMIAKRSAAKRPADRRMNFPRRANASTALKDHGGVVERAIALEFRALDNHVTVSLATFCETRSPKIGRFSSWSSQLRSAEGRQFPINAAGSGGRRNTGQLSLVGKQHSGRKLVVGLGLERLQGSVPCDPRRRIMDRP